VKAPGEGKGKRDLKKGEEGKGKARARTICSFVNRNETSRGKEVVEKKGERGGGAKCAHLRQHLTQGSSSSNISSTIGGRGSERKNAAGEKGKKKEKGEEGNGEEVVSGSLLIPPHSLPRGGGGGGKGGKALLPRVFSISNATPREGR